MERGILYLVPTPIGNLGDMTYRAVEVLKSVNVIACEDTRTSQKLLSHYNIKNKLISYHRFNESKQSATLIELLQSGKNIALITDAGTPAISDPAAILVKAAVNKGINITCLPGATALIPALSASGLDTTRFTFAGFLPAKANERRALLKHLSALPHTVILYESTHSIRATLQELIPYFGERMCVIARELSKLHESFYRDSLSKLAETEFETRGEFVILLEGCPAENISDELIINHLKELSAQGLSGKELLAAVAESTGAARNRVYKLYLALSKDRD